MNNFSLKENKWILPIIILVLINIGNEFRWDYLDSERYENPQPTELIWKTDRWTGYSWLETHYYDFELRVWLMDEEPEYSTWEMRHTARKYRDISTKIYGLLYLACIIWLFFIFVIIPKYRDWKWKKNHA